MGGIDLATYQLVKVEFQAWMHLGQTHLVSVFVYQKGTEVYRKHMGASILREPLLEATSPGMVVYGIGQEIVHAWRELSSPKS